MTERYDCVVIGAGAAGMTAARVSASNGAKTLIIDKNMKVGRKLAITGKGRCNVTNDCTRDGFFNAVRHNPRFLYSAYSSFDNHAAMEFVESMGVPLKVERGARVFPKSDNAFDIVDAMRSGMKNAGVVMKTPAEVSDILIRDGRIVGVKLKDGEEIEAASVVVATGGMSYPSTGSTGDGYRFARAAGHTVTPLRASLVGIETSDIWTGRLAGLTLRNVTLTAKQNGRVIYSDMGEMLFTHVGISGPLVLSLASEIEGDDPSSVEVTLDMKNALTDEQLDSRMLREIADMPKKHVGSLLDKLLPRSLSPIVADISGVASSVLLSQLSKKQRDRLIHTMKCFPIELDRFCPIEEAIVTRGGVDVSGISPSDMGSKLVSGLFFAGEVIDVDARTGGFNLQIAYSTGASAGLGAARHALGEKNI